MKNRTAQEAARYLLEREIPLDVLETINRERGLHLAPGAIFKDALAAVVLQKAEGGDPQAAEMVKRYGLK